MSFVKKASVLIIILCMLGSLIGCMPGIDMPLNGDIVFHDIKAYIPTLFTADSAKSEQDLWIFEYGNYSKTVILKRSDSSGNAYEQICAYADSMKKAGAAGKETELPYGNGVTLEYIKNNAECRELLFAYNESIYSVSLRGGNADEFDEIINKIGING